MLYSHGKIDDSANEFEFICRRREDLQFLFNNLTLELKDHNRAAIRPGFISRTLVDQDFQHTINSLHFLIEGEAVMDFGGQQIPLSAGDIFLIGNHVKCSWTYTAPAEELTLLFNVYLGDLEDLFSHLTSPLILHGRQNTVRSVEALFGEDSGLSALALRHICLQYLEEFLRMSGADIDGRIRTVKKYREVFRYISENLSAGLTVEELAKATNYSVSFFTKSFPRDNGITIKQYIHDKLMSGAEQLLIYSDLPVREISDRCGFCEQAYFTRWFRRYKGCPPTEYRAAIRAITENQGGIPSV